jgi:hypothetical protein
MRLPQSLICWVYKYIYLYTQHIRDWGKRMLKAPLSSTYEQPLVLPQLMHR